MKPFQLQTHYELLEVSVGASTGEIRAAYERLSQLYDDSQVALYGLIDARQASALREKLKKSLEVLTDDDAREAYDVSIGLPPRDVVKAPPKPKPQPSAPGWGAYQVAYVTPTPSVPQMMSGTSSSTYLVPPMPERRAVPREPVAPRPPLAVAPVEPVSALPEVTLAPLPPPPAPVRHEPVEPAPRPPPKQESLFASMPAPQIFERRREPEPSVPQLRLGSPIEPRESVTAVPPRESAPVALPAPVVAEAPPAPSAPAVAASVEPDVPAMSDDDVHVTIAPTRVNTRETRLVDPKPRPYEVPSGVEINGSLLRQVRMARALTVQQLSERTRIGPKHLENLEADKYDALPATVYLRGMLMSLARELGLDGIAVCKSYLAFVDAHRAKH